MPRYEVTRVLTEALSVEADSEEEAIKVAQELSWFEEESDILDCQWDAQREKGEALMDVYIIERLERHWYSVRAEDEQEAIAKTYGQEPDATEVIEDRVTWVQVEEGDE